MRAKTAEIFWATTRMEHRTGEKTKATWTKHHLNTFTRSLQLSHISIYNSFSLFLLGFPSIFLSSISCPKVFRKIRLRIPDLLLLTHPIDV